MFLNYTHISTRSDQGVCYAEIDIQTNRFLVQAIFAHSTGQITVSLADKADQGSLVWSNDGSVIASVDLPARISKRRLRHAIRSAIKQARYMLGTDYRWSVHDLRHYASAQPEWNAAT